MFYAQSTSGFYCAEIHGGAIPLDAVEIDDSTYMALLDGQSAGMWITAAQDGSPVLVAPAPPDPAAVLASKLVQVRAAREVILNRLAGIALAAQLTGDTDTTAAYVAVRQGLLQITDDLPMDGTDEAVVMTRYGALVAICAPAMVSAFAQVDA